MALYEYRCEDCDNVFEVFKKMKDQTPEVCPKCLQFNTKKLISAPGWFDLRGKGFFQNDYPKAKEKK
jgi:putative FmdB family regulatory protein